MRLILVQSVPLAAGLAHVHRLFGVHETAGIVRVDACGALVLPITGPVRAITATEIAFGHLTHREKPGQPQGIPWWAFGR